MAYLYDRKRLLANHEAWERPIRRLLDGLANHVITIDELERDSRFIYLGLHKFLSIYESALPKTVLIDFIKRYRASFAREPLEPCTYHYLHKLAKSSNSDHWKISVRLGKIMRREKFSWSSDFCEGLYAIKDYLSSASLFAERLGIRGFSNYGKFDLINSIGADIPLNDLLNHGKFDQMRDISRIISEWEIDQIDRMCLPFSYYTKIEIDEFDQEFEIIKNSLANLGGKIKRSDLINDLPLKCPNSLKIDWIRLIAGQLKIEEFKAPNGFWWLSPADQPI